MTNKYTTKREDPIHFECGVSAIQLTQGRYALVDTEDAEHLSRWVWHICEDSHTCYVRRRATPAEAPDGKSQVITMHHAILGDPPFTGAETDHINGHGLDNRRTNLRWVTSQQNKWNRRRITRGSSRFLGVCRARGKWVANIREGGILKHLGYFEAEEDAAQAYREAAALRTALDSAKENS